VDPATDALQDIYFAMSNAATTTVGDLVGKKPQKALLENNKIMSKLFRDKDALGKLINTQDASPEKIYQNLIGSADTAKLNSVVEFFGADSPIVKQMKAAYLDNMKRLGKEGNFSIQQLMNKVRNDPKMGPMKALFKQGELDDFAEVLGLGEKYGDYILNPSGTAVFQEAGDPLRQLTQSSTSDALTSFMKDQVAGRPGEVPAQNIINSNKAAGKVESPFTGVKSSMDAGPKPSYAKEALRELPAKGALRAIGTAGQEDRTQNQKRLIEDFDKVKYKAVSPKQAQDLWENSP
jgi:hypothetical protein